MILLGYSTEIFEGTKTIINDTCGKTGEIGIRYFTFQIQGCNIIENLPSKFDKNEEYLVTWKPTVNINGAWNKISN